MTCIIGITDGVNVHMAGDLLASNGFTKKVYGKPKVFINKDFIFGYTTSFRMGQLLEYSWCPPERGLSQKDDDYIYKTVSESFIKLFKVNDYGHKSGADLETGEFLFGYRGRLFLHQGDHSILENNSFSIGSGSYHAEAALETLLEYTSWVGYESLLERAIEISSRMVASVSKECTYLSLEGSSEV